MKKRLLSFFTILFSIVYIFTACRQSTSYVFPENTVVHGEEFSCSVNELYGILDRLDSSVIYKIHITDENPNFRKMKRAFSNHNDIDFHLYLDLCTTPIEIPDSAFEELYNIISIKLPEQIKYIGDNSFHNCRNLVECNLPSDLIEIGYSAFFFCKSLKSVELPNSLEVLRDACFEYCDEIQTIDIPKKIKQIPKSCFSGCDKLTIVNFHGSLEYIGEYAFSSCYEIEKLELPDTVKIIKNSAFYNCSKMSELHLPAELEEIAGDVYEDCRALKNPKFPEDVKVVGALNISCTLVEEFTIPDDVEVLDRGCFCLCEKLNKITFNDFLNQITELPESCFSFCKSLKNFVIPPKIKKIGNRCFSGSHLESIVFSEDLTEIGNYAFEDCDFSELTIPKTVQKIGEGAFFNNYKLTELCYEGTGQEFLDIILENCNNDRKINFVSQSTKKIVCSDTIFTIDWDYSTE